MVAHERGAAQPRPETAIRRRDDAEHPRPAPTAEPRLEETKRQAVEPDEPLLRADPQIAVRALRDRVNGAAGKARRGIPAVAEVLRERALDVQRLVPEASAVIPASTRASASRPRAAALRQVLEPFNDDLDILQWRLRSIAEEIEVHPHPLGPRRRNARREFVLRDRPPPVAFLPRTVLNHARPGSQRNECVSVPGGAANRATFAGT